MKVFQLIGTHPPVLLVNQLQSREEKCYRASTVFVHDLDLFVTVQLLDYTPAVLSLGTLFEENGFFL